MTDPEEKNKPPKPPPEVSHRTTPYGTPAPSEGTVEFSLEEASLDSLRERYDLLAELGRGGMGVVYKARDRETGDIVALKLLLPEIANRNDLIERFKAELLLARKVTHKSVCRVYDLNRFGDVAAISMEYVEGESLRSLLGRVRGFSVSYGLAVLKQLLAGLAEAHKQGVVHRDLKPENIVVSREGAVKVMDFGIARSVEADSTVTGTGTGMLIGTPAYMSPEQAEGRPADSRSDIYALGLIMYEVFTGRPAFVGDTPVAYAVKQLHETPLPPSEIEPYLPSFVERAIEKCLRKDPKKRFQSVAELEAALGEKQIAPTPTTTAELPTRLTMHRRSDWALLLAGLAGLVVFLLGIPAVSPETGLRIQLTRQMLIQNARQELAARGWEAADQATAYVLTHGARNPYRFIASRDGYAAAREALQEYPPILYEVQLVPSDDGAQSKARVTYDMTGSLRLVEIPPENWVPEETSTERDAGRELALQELRDHFGVETAELTLEHEEAIVEGNRRGYDFRWVEPQPNGLHWEYKVHVFDRTTTLERRILPPDDFTSQDYGTYKGHSFVSTLLVWLLAAVLFFARQLFRETGLRDALFLVGFGLFFAVGTALAISSPSGARDALTGSAFAFVVLFMLVILALFYVAWLFPLPYATGHLARRVLPHLTTS